MGHQGKEHRWIPAQSEFKNKLLIARIKANFTFTHRHNAKCDPLKKQIYLFFPKLKLACSFLFHMYFRGNKGEGVFPQKL